MTVLVRVRRAAFVLVLVLVLVLLAALVGCTPQPTAPASEAASAVVVATATSSEPAPALSRGVEAKLRAIATSAEGGAVDVVVGSGTARQFDLVPRRPNGDVDHGFHRDERIDANIDAVADAVGELAATESGMDLVETLNHATRGREPRLLIVISSGLSTGGAIDLRELGWGADPDDVVAALKAQNTLPKLKGWRVVFSGLGLTAGAQLEPKSPTRDILIAYVTAICTAAEAAACEIDETERETEGPNGTAGMPLIDIPVVNSIDGPDGRTTESFPASLLGFAGNSSEPPDRAAEVLHDTVLRIVAVLAEEPGARVTVTGYTADPPPREGDIDSKTLSGWRAKAVAELLIAAGVNPAAVDVVAGGTAPGLTAIVNGHFDNARAEQMRRVDITY